MEYSPFASAQPAPAFAPAVAPGNLSAVIARVAEAVEAETIGLRTDRNFDIRASNARKSRCLYELSRAAKGMGDGDMLREHAAALGALKKALAHNESVVRAHLDAVGEVAALLKGAIEHAHSDGTYSSGGYGQGGW
ncbi:MAG: hypothetical protein DI629_02955 [Mesorhizobium amorphae]|nr:MAG: hypothetical protein DI629_02955 [Mesorhizobium amorphae]